MVLVNTLLLGLRMFSDIGIGASIVQNSKGGEPRFLDTAWTLQILRGLLLFVVALSLAVPMAGFYEQPALVQLIPVAAATILLDGFGSTSLSSLKRELRVKQLTLLDVSCQATSLVVMIIWALVAPSVWVLVGGALAGSAVRLVAGHTVLSQRRNRFDWHRASAIAVMGFGSWVLLNTAIAYAADQADRFVLGKLVDMDVLGVYSIAVLVGGIPYLVLGQLGGMVVFPAFSRARHHGKDLVEAYGRMRQPVLVGGAWLVGGLVACGPPAILLLWDPRWHGAAPMLLPIAVAQWLRVLYIPASNALFAMGRLRWVVSANALKLVGYAVFVPLGYQRLGLLGALYGFAAGELVGYLVYVAGLAYQGIRPFGKDLLATLAAGGVAALAVLLRDWMVGAGAPLVLAFLAAGVLVTLAWLRPALRLARALRAP
jgi:O-antigen/teichoic acid export membrane protein